MQPGRASPGAWKLSVKSLIIAYKLPKPKRWCGLEAYDLFLPFGMLAYDWRVKGRDLSPGQAKLANF
jgi:hypothetical protein